MDENADRKMEISSMELIELGMDIWFKDQARALCASDQQIARITVVNRGQYIARNAHGEVPAKVTGKFMHSAEPAIGMPCVGDWVCVDYQDAENCASIHSILPRKSFLRRKSAGKSNRLQMIAANIDVVFIVQSCNYDFNVSRLERYLVMANEGQVEPLLVLTKIDLICADELEKLISEIRGAGIDIRIIAISNVSGAGLDQLKEVMRFGKTYCLTGSSGVGKTTLINQLTGNDALKTGIVSDSGEGRHTTVRRQLILLEQGAMLIDTPGMREVGVAVASEEIEDNFDDIQNMSLHCRFNDCSHKNEPGCAVVKAIEAGKLHREHYLNYLKLKVESESKEMSYTDKRKKAKTAGTLVHRVMKQKTKPE